SETLKGHDLVLVAGSSVFPYYPYLPGPLLPDGAALVALTSDPNEAARAPMGDAILGDVALALERLVELVGASERAGAEPRPGHVPRAAKRGLLDPQVVRDAGAGVGRAGPRAAGARRGRGCARLRDAGARGERARAAHRSAPGRDRRRRRSAARAGASGVGDV